MFSARLKLKGTHAMRVRRVNEMLRELDLLNCQNTRVGSTLEKGISGGEKRRVSIGIELLTNPPVIFLDGTHLGSISAHPMLRAHLGTG